MRRLTCISAIALQLILLSLLLSQSLSGGDETILSDNAFLLLGGLFVVLSPFGLFSLIMTAAFSRLVHSSSMGDELLRRSETHSPEMFFVWHEVRRSVRLKDGQLGL